MKMWKIKCVITDVTSLLTDLHFHSPEASQASALIERFIKPQKDLQINLGSI